MCNFYLYLSNCVRLTTDFLSLKQASEIVTILFLSSTCTLAKSGNDDLNIQDGLQF